MKQFRGLCLSSFNISTFVQLLNNDEQLPPVLAEAGEYGQWFLSSESKAGGTNAIDFKVVWTLPEHVSPAFSRLLQFESVDGDALNRDVDQFCQAIAKTNAEGSLLFLPLWLIAPHNRGLGTLDLTMESSINRALMEMNLRLCRNLVGNKGIFLLNSSRWLVNAGKRAFQPKSWYMTKSPFSNDFFVEAVQDIKTALLASLGKSKKLIVLDLDETLWGGIVGDVGWQSIRLGGHDYIGEAFQDFQRALKSLKNRGLLLAIASKNEESIALEAIRRHPEMVLKLEDFVGWRINWNDKAQNIVELVKELNLGLDSVVFIDDSEFERQRVRDALPEVFVPNWPEDKTQYTSCLMALRCFDSLQISAEDATRTKMYQEDDVRSKSKLQHSSLEDWLASLKLTVTVRKLEEVDLPRVVQLLNKTNQMNLTTRRLNEQEFKAWCETSGAEVWSIRVADRFGDSGLTGVMSVVADPKVPRAARIVDYILSCRVLGRKVEEVMLHVAIAWAQSQRMTKVLATYIPTEKNKVCLDFWMNSGFERFAAGNTFEWPTEKSHTLPLFINVQTEASCSGPIREKQSDLTSAHSLKH